MKKFIAIMVVIAMLLSSSAMTASASDAESINENIETVEIAETVDTAEIVESADTVEANADTVDVGAVETVEATDEVHKHVFSYAIDEVGHVMSCSECGVNAGAEEAHTFSSTSSCTVCGYSVHTCNIARANEDYHSIDCYCGNYVKVKHNKETMEATFKNDFFHVRACECGYEYAETHNFKTGYNETAHYKVCLDCGYKRSMENHFLESTFSDIYHDIECDSCRYASERHIGVKYTVIDATSCQATCKECGTSEVLPHEWDGFECYNCGYEKGMFSCGIVVDIYRNTEDYTLELIINDEWIEIDVHTIHNWDFAIGDFVQIFHQGNNIFDIVWLVDGSILNDPEHSELYLDAEVTTCMNYTGIQSNTVEEVSYNEDKLIITFEDGRTLEFVNYIIYDFEEADIVDVDFIEEGERLAWYTMDGTTFYILDYCY